MRTNESRTVGARGFTLIEILVVITIIAALTGLVASLIPMAIEHSNRATCTNNLHQIGGLLHALEGSGQLENYSGAAFLLQVAPHINDEDLTAFICPGEDDNIDDPRPKDGSEAFISMYRDEMDLASGKIEDRYCSYAGPNLKDFPPARIGRESKRSRFLGCDKCRNGQAHHDGIAVLYSTSKVAVLPVADLAGHGEDAATITVGKGSPDPRLEAMTFFPPR